MATSQSTKIRLRWPQLRWHEKPEHEREGWAIVGFFLAAFLWLSLWGYVPQDPSWFAASSPPRSAENWLGPAGSYTAGALIHLFGVLAYFLPLPLLNLSWVALHAKRGRYSLMRSVGWLYIYLSFSLILSKKWPELAFAEFDLPSAGMIGQEFSFVVMNVGGALGLWLFSLCLLWLGALMISRRALLKPSLKLIGNPLRHLRQNSTFRWNFLRKKRPSQSSKKPLSKPTHSLETPPENLDKPASLSFDKKEPAIIESDSMPQTQTTEKDLGLDRQDTKTLRPNLAPSVSKHPNRSHLSSLTAPTPCEPEDGYEPPDAQLFKTNPNGMQVSELQKQEFQNTADQLIKTLADFSIEGEVVAIQPGPVVAVYEFQPKAGTKLSKLTALLDDIALALKVDSIFIHPVSGKRAVGIQVPNKKREVVYLGDIIQSSSFEKSKSPLTFAMGKSLSGEPVCEDLASMPHLLTAGQTGSGKSVAINTLLCSIIMKASPQDVRMILVDPKILELKIYEGIPHLLMPVITEAPRASLALKWACYEMDRRYQLMELARVRHISAFNQFWAKASASQRVDIEQQAETGNIGHLPYIVIVIDELADLMLTAPKDVEASIQRLAQKARASGIHLVLATQRPSVDVITGVIKANLPCRSSFKVFSRGDSRTILDCIGAERLLGKGDMLFLKPGSSRLQRLQGAFLGDDEVVSMVESVSQKSRKTNYDEEAISWIEDAFHKVGSTDKSSNDLSIFEGNTEDPKWDEALHIAQTQGQISASFLQRSLKIGYNRAARMVEAMESQGLVGPAEGSKPRKWLGTGIEQP